MYFLFLFTVVGGILGLVWALRLDKGVTKYGWAFYCLYAGNGLIVISFALSIVMLCVRAPGAYRTTNKDDEIAMLAR